MIFDSENWRRRVKLTQTEEEVTALAKELTSKPMDITQILNLNEVKFFDSK
ncbi:MAG TPA: hypothetical protein VIO39_03735 [Methylotenera sp.]